MAVRTASPTVCVFGGTGFVGRTLAARLVAAGYDVRVPTRSRARHRELLVLPGVELVEADIHRQSTVNDLLAGAQAAVNLVGILNERGRDGTGFHHAHVALVEKIAAACRERGVRRLLHVSALQANAERGPSHYLRTKGAGEQVLKDLPGRRFHYTILRPSVIFGPDDSFVNRFAGLLRLLPVFPLAKPDAQFAPVYVEDVAEACVRALQTEAAFDQTYQLCGPESYSLKSLVELIARTMAIRRIVWGLPDSLARVQAGVMEYVPGKPLSVDNYRSLTVPSTCTENGLAALGITATSMQVILPRYLHAEGPRQRLLSRLRRRSGR